MIYSFSCIIAVFDHLVDCFWVPVSYQQYKKKYLK